MSDCVADAVIWHARAVLLGLDVTFFLSVDELDWRWEMIDGVLIDKIRRDLSIGEGCLGIGPHSTGQRHDGNQVETRMTLSEIISQGSV